MNIESAIANMTLKEKIGQKIMLDFRYWDPEGKATLDMTVPDDAIRALIVDNNIGGVILFSNNLKDSKQINVLTQWYSKMQTAEGLRLFIGTDNEGGNVFRLPRDEYASFPGNMALGAAIEGNASLQDAYEQGRIMAEDLLSFSINTNFGPVVDVNTNPFNPVINVRSFSDDAARVSKLAETFVAGMHKMRMIVAYKHFPGHGSTSVDSHSGLPRVNRSRVDAFAIDIAPYSSAIQGSNPPDMIMTAHIQYPSLDDTLIENIKGEKIIIPATMSHKIQTDIVRDQLGYRGLTITDALDMGAIVDNFSQSDAIRQVFAAGVDIALMPISITAPSQAGELQKLIQYVVDEVNAGRISEKQIDLSVARILDLKKKRYLIGGGHLSHLKTPRPFSLQDQIADGSITVIINQQKTLPLIDKEKRFFIMTPWGEQANAIAEVMKGNDYQNIVNAKESDLTDSEIMDNIAKCDVFLLGTLSSSFSPVEDDGIAIEQKKAATDQDKYLGWLRYAKRLNKTRVHLSLRAPYDIINYSKDVDAAVATYSYYGYYNGKWRGPSMKSLARVLTGVLSPQGKLPVDIWQDYDVDTNTGTVAFPRGFGLSWGAGMQSGTT